jgi:hypothetical protein
MKSIFDGYPSKKDFVVEGITGLIWGFVAYIFFIFFVVSIYTMFIGTLVWVYVEITKSMHYPDMTSSLPLKELFSLGLILLFSMIHFIVLRGALKKKERAFIIFYPIGLAVSILFSYNFGTIR